MAGVVDYASLKTEVGNWMHRSDLAGEMDVFIQMAENTFNRKLRTRRMDTLTTIPTVSNTMPLPVDFVQARNVDLVLSSGVRPLVYVSPEQKDLYDLQTSTGQPRMYTIAGNNLLIAPTPDQVYSLNFEYFALIPTLVGGQNTTNWLIQFWPDAYLFGTLLAATAFIGDDSRVGMWQNAWQAAVDDINREDDDGQFSGGTIRVRPDVAF